MMKSYSTQVNIRENDVTVSDIISSKQDHIHNEMYVLALEKYVSYAGIDPEAYSFIELPSSYYDSPSRVKIISQDYPYRRKIVDLAPYWDTYKFKDKISYLQIDKENSIATSEVIYRDYVHGYAEIRSKMTGRIVKVNLKDLDGSIPDVEDEKSLRHTFGYKLRHKIYGRDPWGKEG